MATLSGQKTVTVPGTAEQLSSGQVINGPLMVKALTTNTDLAYVGNVAGDVSSANGMPLSAGDPIVFQFVGYLASIWVDVAVGGEGVAWLALEL